MIPHQENYYEGMAWANEIAKRGYVVLVSDAFPFASRRVKINEVPERLRQGLNDSDPENPENIKTYNQWAADHADIMAKSLFSAGTTWPGVFLQRTKRLWMYFVTGKMWMQTGLAVVVCPAEV